MPKQNYMKFMLFILVMSGCIKTELTTDSQNSSNQQSTQEIFKTNLRSVKSIDARKIFKAKMDGITQDTNIVTLTFVGRELPSMRFYKHELKNGIEFNIIPPTSVMNSVVLKKIDSGNKTLSTTIFKLKNGEINILKI